MIVFAILTFAVVFAADSTPESVAFRCANTILQPQYINTFLDSNGLWDYSGALMNIGFFEVLTTFTDNATETDIIYKTISQYMDAFYAQGREAYNVTNNITMPWDHDVGDHIGLYPVSYLMRYQYSAQPQSNDLVVAQRVAEQYVINFPVHLPDGTFSRAYGWGNQTGNNSFLWCDDVFMGLTLVNRLAIYYKKAEYIDFTTSQLLSFASNLQDTDGVFIHGFNTNGSVKSCCKWGRANGWVIMSLVETLLAFEAFPGHPQQPAILDIYRKQVQGLKNLQDPEGRWHQVLNETSIWLETSCSAMFTFAFSTGIVKGWISDADYGQTVDIAWKSISQTVLDDGTVQGICEGCPIEIDVPHYANHSTAYTTSGPGLGSILRAAAAYEKLLRARIL